MVVVVGCWAREFKYKIYMCTCTSARRIESKNNTERNDSNQQLNNTYGFPLVRFSSFFSFIIAQYIVLWLTITNEDETSIV